MGREMLQAEAAEIAGVAYAPSPATSLGGKPPSLPATWAALRCGTRTRSAPGPRTALVVGRSPPSGHFAGLLTAPPPSTRTAVDAWPFAVPRR